MKDLDRALKDFVAANTPPGPPPPLAGTASSAAGREADSDAVRRPARTSWLAAAAAVVLVTAGASTWWAQRDPSTDPTADPGAEPGVTVLDQGGASDHLPSTTAEDWVTYADHVLLVTVTGEREVPPAPEEVQRGEGLIGREITTEVEEVVWSRPDPDRPAPAVVSWQAWGWQFDGDPDADRTPVVGAGTSRLEVGHTYVVALAWEDARCSAGDPEVPARWTPLGGAAVVAAEDGTIGVGEVEGRDQTAAEARAADDPDDPNRTVADRLAGEDVDALAATLVAARAGEPEEFTPPAPCP